MCRMSSPGTYSRCWTNSTEKPRKGLLCSPMRSPSTMPRAFRPRASARAKTSGWRVSGMSVLRHRLEHLADDVLDADALRLGREVRDQPVPEDRRGDGGNVVGGRVEVAAQDGVGLGSEDEVHAGARPGAPGEPLVDEVGRL